MITVDKKAIIQSVDILPKDWKVEKLGEALVRIAGGGTPSKEIQSFWGGEIPWASVKDMGKELFKGDTLEYITEDGRKNSSTNLINPFTVIIATRMGLGRAFINTVPMAINQDLKALFPKSYLDTKYLLYWYLSKGSQIISMGSGSTVKGIRLGELKGLEIFLPPLSEQRQIATILTIVDEGISKTDEIIEQTKKVKKGLMLELLTKGIGHTEFKKTELGEIPVGWDVKKLDDVVKFEGGSQPPLKTFVFEPMDGYIRLIQIRDFKDDKHVTYIPNGLARKFCKKDDVMIGRYGPPIFQILTGLEGAYNVALIKAIPTELMIKKYLYYFLKQENLFRLIEHLSQRTSGQTGIDMEFLRSYGLPLPPLKEQIHIVEVLTAVDRKLEVLGKRKSQLEQTKRGLMQDLLTGRVRVKV
ncbi:restriction endonuclease subunit S [Desulfosporosinus burensis]